MKRRTFIWTPLLISLGSVLKLDAQAGEPNEPEGPIQIALTELLGSFNDLSDVADVGKRYLIQYPGSAEIDQLILAIGQTYSATNFRSDQIADMARVRFEEAKRQDFTASNIVCLDGWVLSKAEASLCALAYLSPLSV